MDDLEHRELRPIFKPLRSKFMPMHIPLGKFLAIIGVTLAGLVLALALGNVTHEVEISYTKAEYSTLTSEYEAAYQQLAGVEAQRLARGAASYEDMELSQTQREAIVQAEEMGIEYGMSTEEVDALVPTTYVGVEPVIPDAVRIVLLTAVPFILGVTLFIEVNRTSAYKELKRARRFANSQRVYKCRPVDYMERATGLPYQEARELGARSIGV